MIDKEQIENWKMTYHDPYDGAPVVDDAYKQDFSHKYGSLLENCRLASLEEDDQKDTVMSMVREFAIVMGQEPNELMALELVYEEWAEFRDAEHPLDDLKELADLIYVLYGYANVMGYDLDEAIRRVHKNNVERCIQADGTVRRRQDGKILRRADAPSVDLRDLV